jgi:hypothetical protein
MQLLNAAMPAEPERLWDTGPDVGALVAAWRSECPAPPYKFTPWEDPGIAEWLEEDDPGRSEGGGAAADQ